MRTIAIINQKGGCGKTTTAINLAGQLARSGERVLLVDMDPQSHCAAGLGVPEHRIDLDIGDAMLAAGSRPIDPSRLLWRTGRNLDLAPSRMRLAGLEAARGGLSDAPDKERRLALALDSLRAEYDLCLIDCSPAIGLLTFNALAAADTVLVPVETSFFSLQGATKQVNTVKSLSRRLGVVRPLWLLPTIHDDSSAVARDLLGELERRFKERLAPVVIRRDTKLREAASFGQTILDYAPDSTGAEDYARLARWVREAAGMPAGAHDACDEDELTIQSYPRDPGQIVPRRPDHAEPHASPAIAAPSPGSATGTSPGATPLPHPVPEVKPISRAEDVARRAQQFLRRAWTTASDAGAHDAGASSPLPSPSPSPSPGAGAAPGASPGVALLAPANVLRVEPPAPIAGAEPDASARVLLGARCTRRGVLFVQPAALGARVAVAGDFNGWRPNVHPMNRRDDLGVHELCLRLPPGRHRYRLVVDGHWTADSYNPECDTNPFGGQDSVVVVPAEGAAP